MASLAPVPLTERILNRLGLHRSLLIAAWGLFTFLMFYEIPFRVFHVTLYPGLPYAVAAACVNVLSLLGVGMLARQIAAVQPDVDRLTAGSPGNQRPFEPVGSIAGPFIVDLVFLLFVAVADHVTRPGPAIAALIPIQVVAWLPVNTFLWVFGSVLLGLDRLGRTRLNLSIAQGRSLGLQPLGALAFSGFFILIAGAFPLLITGARSLRDAAGALIGLFTLLILFFSALYRLHTQLVRAKSHYVAQARRLSAQAIAPVENTWSLDVLVAEAPRLNAAEALEKRAAAIQEWPIDETLFARVAALTTSVATAIVVRLILSRLGL